MRSSRLHTSSAIAWFTLAAMPAFALVQLVGCGGDDSSVGHGMDASVDATNDAPLPEIDSSLGGDTGTDAPEPVDARADAGSDASLDSGACAVAVPATAEAFFAAYANELCTSLNACCNLGAKFDTAKCQFELGAPGSNGFLGAGIPTQYLSGGRIAYDPVAACSCFEAIATINCALVPQDTVQMIQRTCLAALHGTVEPVSVPDGGTDAGDAGAADAGDAGPDGGDSGAVAKNGCTSSYECVNSYCTVNLKGGVTDAGLGTCVPLSSDGGACTDDRQCSYLGNGDPPLYCKDGTCAPRLPAGTTCQSSGLCQSNLCVPNVDAGTNSCASGLVFASPTACQLFTVPDPTPDAGSTRDAGDGG